MAAKRTSIAIFALIAFSFMFSSLTTLRFTGVPVGISELLLLVCMVLHLPLSMGLHVTNRPRYTAGVVFLLFLATLPGFIITVVQQGTVDYTLYNLFALLYIVLLVSYLHYGFNYNQTTLENLIVFFTAFSVLYFFLLFALLFFDPGMVYFQDEIEDISLENATAVSADNRDGPTFRLLGFSENPNQLALHALIVSFFAVAIWRRLGFMLGCVSLFSAMIVGVLTHSDAFLISAIALIFISVVMGIVMGRSVILGLTVLVPSVVGLFFLYTPAVNRFREIAQYGDQDTTRYNLWLNGIEAGMQRPLTGMGPGIWSGEGGPFEQMEAHNTAIDYFSMAGVPGTVLLFVATVYLVFYCFRSGRSTILAGLVAIAVYAAFHNILRHPLVWLAIYFIVHSSWSQMRDGQRGSSNRSRRRRKIKRSRGLEL